MKAGTSAVDAVVGRADRYGERARAARRIGFLNSALYSDPVVRSASIVPGQQPYQRQGAMTLVADWNACAGLGVPKGADIIAALAAAPVA